MATDPPPGLLHALVLAIGDPGSVAERGDESVPDWKARAVLEAVRPFLVPVLTGNDRAEVEEARRILSGEVSWPASYSVETALRDCARMLLDLVDKIAPKEAG